MARKTEAARGADAEVITNDDEPTKASDLPGIGHNAGPLEAAKFHPLYANLQRKMADLALAKGAVQKVRKQLKAEGVKLKVLDAAMTLAELPIHDQREHVAMQKQILEFLRAPIGTQMSMMDILKPDPLDDSPEADAARVASIEEDAGAKGWLAGISGKDEDNPHEANTPAGQAWLSNYRDGRAKFDEAVDDEDV